MGISRCVPRLVDDSAPYNIQRMRRVQPIRILNSVFESVRHTFPNRDDGRYLLSAVVVEKCSSIYPAAFSHIHFSALSDAGCHPAIHPSDMDPLVTIWDQPDFTSWAVGGKARALAHAGRAGFKVPACIVVRPNAGEWLLAPGARDRLMGRDKGESAKEALTSQSLSTEAVEELLAIVRQELPGVTRFAVRSSALDEDSRTHSFAGQLDSFLDVPLADIPRPIIAVRKSGFSERVYLYRQQNRLPLPPPVPAVIVQEMVPAEPAGVAFSVDPVSCRSGTPLVAPLRGLCDNLCSDEYNSDNFGS